MKNYEYPGAVHIHSIYSDGTGTIEEIIRDAQRAGLKFIIITDHDNMKALENGYEGYHKDLCVLVGEEISPDKNNHYLALNLTTTISSSLKPEEFINEVNSQGGFGFIAHPDEQIIRDNNYPALRWDNWEIENFQGLEIWNHLSDWVDTLSSKNKVYKALFPDKTLHGPTKDTLKWWDDLNNKHSDIYPGLAGIDVHAFNRNFLIFPIKIFSYYKSFKTLRNYIQTDEILSADFETAKNQIYTALKNGNNIMANYSEGNPAGTVFTITKQTDNNKFIKASSGEFLSADMEFTIDIEVPSESNIKLIHNGRVIKEEKTSHLRYINDKHGFYRAEIFKNNRPWIFTNPIKVIKQ